MTNKPPKAIFFDLDETLLENKIPMQALFTRMYINFEDQLGADNQTLFFNELRQRAANLWDSMFETTLAPERQFINCFRHCIAATNSNNQSKTNALAQEMFDHFRQISARNVVLHDGAEEVLHELSKQELITGIITNGLEQIQLGKIHQLGLQNMVDQIVVSAQARAHKPRSAVFLLALERAGVAAEEAWQIGDHATNDVAGAIRVGMGGVFYNPKNTAVSDAFTNIDEQPTHVINHHCELLNLLC